MIKAKGISPEWAWSLTEAKHGILQAAIDGVARYPSEAQAVRWASERMEPLALQLMEDHWPGSTEHYTLAKAKAAVATETALCFKRSNRLNITRKDGISPRKGVARKIAHRAWCRLAIAKRDGK